MANSIFWSASGFQDNNTGEFIEYPDGELITPEIISYWETRINNARIVY